MSTDTLADMFTIIRNGYQARKDVVFVPSSKLKKSLAQIMVEEHYLHSFEEIKDKKGFLYLKLTLLYHQGKPAIHTIKRISKPGLRVYKKAKDLTLTLYGYGVTILSTSQGVMTDKQAKTKNIGGEVLCELW